MCPTYLSSLETIFSILMSALPRQARKQINLIEPYIVKSSSNSPDKGMMISIRLKITLKEAKEESCMILIKEVNNTRKTDTKQPLTRIKCNSGVIISSTPTSSSTKITRPDIINKCNSNWVLTKISFKERECNSTLALLLTEPIIKIITDLINKHSSNTIDLQMMFLQWLLLIDSKTSSIRIKETTTTSSNSCKESLYFRINRSIMNQTDKNFLII